MMKKISGFPPKPNLPMDALLEIVKQIFPNHGRTEISSTVNSDENVCDINVCDTKSCDIKVCGTKSCDINVCDVFRILHRLL